MKLSLEWLGSMVDWKEKDPVVIADRLTLSVAEVEEMEVQGKLLRNCCVGKVLKLVKHPGADRLSLADVQTDKGMKRVVCGGTNLREGMLVAFAHTGATVKHGEELVTLTAVKIRGEASEGMICAAIELDLGELFPPKHSDGDHPIIDVTRVPGIKTGMSLADALGLNDTIFHISNTALTHRPDLFSHMGFAREFVALGLATWKRAAKTTAPKAPKTPLPFKTHVDIPKLVPRYCSCLITVDNIGETPAWMKKRLEATGWRSVSLPVDITNYVTMELGMPLHCFDADDIKGDVRFRTAKKGETITTLDGVKRPLPEGAIVLSDDEGIFDLMGVMGGLRSSTKSGSKRLYLHSTAVDPISIRRTIIATGHRTDAATVYEKGIPPVIVEAGFLRALGLILELAPGAKLASKIESWGSDGKAPKITLPLAQLTGALGAEISAKQASVILTNLGCSVKATKASLTVTPPLHRLRDLKTPEDVTEEVARHFGYHRIHPTMPVAALDIPKREERIHILRDALKEDGFTEIVPLSLIGPDLLKKCNLDPLHAMRLEHPLSEDFSLLHPATLPSLLAHAQRNLLFARDSIQTWHGARIFPLKGEEHLECSVLLASLIPVTTATDPFLRLRRSLARSFAESGWTMSIVPSKTIPSVAHPGRCADIVVAGKTIGAIFEIHPAVRARFDLTHRSAAATFHVTDLLDIPSGVKLAAATPHFPAVTYDLTVKRTHQKPFAGLMGKLEKSDPLLESVAVHDLYSGAPLRENEYNLTLRCTYRSADRTLTEEEAKKAHEKVAALASTM
ncbi:phenylalanine--tRNA ligase subunit beta [Candidatus Peregrinibacteria bacterium]|nr:phenylalanine--tRNA ligase subunit beta [Candidatus Peregrinibacteria bacterium]